MEGHSVLLPTVNALLNALSTALLTAGWLSIRQKDKLRHKTFMVAALVSSTLFLTIYVLNRVIVGGFTRYQGEGLSRLIYFIVLGTHTPLAMIILPFSILAVWHALKGDLKSHVKITRWLLPVWIYVSLTGVMIYMMLYVL